MTFLGAGVLMNPGQISDILKSEGKIDWVEITADHLIGSRSSRFRPVITKQVEKVFTNFPVSLHSLELSIGSIDPLDMAYLKGLKELKTVVQPQIMSDHLVWTGAMGFHAHDLLPFPYTKESLDHVVDRIQKVQDFLGQQFLFENPPAYMVFEHAEYSEAAFMNEMADRSGCGLLIDLTNLYVSSENNTFSRQQFIKDINPKHIQQFHLAGISTDDKSGFLLDHHANALDSEVWNFYEFALTHLGPRSTIIEWSSHVNFKELYEQFKKAKLVINKARSFAA